MQRISLSEHFFLDEFCRSETADRFGHPVHVEPDSPVFHNLRRLCRTVLEPLRRDLGRPVVITSGYRPEWLNLHIGGSENSDHLSGNAADFIVSGMTPYAVGQRIVSLGLPFTQLINEYGRWLHIASREQDQPPRRQVLTFAHNGERRIVHNELISIPATKIS